MSKERLSWIDIAKGIGIILVIYGHALSADSLRYLIYAFHMPLFFFLSGLVFRHKPEEKIVIFLRKNVKNILFPYLLFAVLSFLLWIFTREVPIEEQMKQFLSIFYGNGNVMLSFNNILWFLPCLFITRVGFYLLTRLSIKTNFLLSFLFIFSIVGYVFSLFFPGIKLFFGLETALTAAVFFGLGYYWMTLPEHFLSHVKRNSWFIILGSFIVFLLFAVWNFQIYGLQIDLRQNRLNNYVLFYVAALAGVAMTIFISYMIKTNQVLEYLGKKTLVLFVWHLIIFSYISKFLSVTHLNLYLKQLPTFMSPIIYSFLSIVAILAIAFIVDVMIIKLKKFPRGLLAGGSNQ